LGTPGETVMACMQYARLATTEFRLAFGATPKTDARKAKKFPHRRISLRRYHPIVELKARDCVIKDGRAGVSDMEAIGRTRWAIAEGYIPSESSFSERALVSHETACILNATDRDAHVAITIFFANRDPVGPYRVTVAARRTLHLRFNDLEDPQPIPRDTDYASVFESDVPIVVQHTRLDSRHAEVALLSTMAYAAP
jgi:hypothetical protein